jgi:hypothetical protein
MSHRKPSKSEKDTYYEIEILKAKMEQMEKRLDFMQASVQNLMQQDRFSSIRHHDGNPYARTETDDSTSATTSERSAEEEIEAPRRSNTQMQRRAPV